MTSLTLQFTCPCGTTTDVPAYTARLHPTEPAVHLTCPCGADVTVVLHPVVYWQVRVARLRAVVELARWADAIGAVETPADLAGVDRG